MKKVFVDTNVVLDFLLKRENFYPRSTFAYGYGL